MNAVVWGSQVWSWGFNETTNFKLENLFVIFINILWAT